MRAKNHWQVKFWRVPQLDDLELLHGADITYEYPPHMHEEHSIALVLQGSETTTCRGQSHTALSGSLLLINADEVHSSRSVRVEYRVIKIRSKTLDEIARGLFQQSLERPCFPKLVIKDVQLFRLLLSLHLKLEQNDSALEQESEFISTIGLLLTRQHKNHIKLPRPTREPHYVKLVRDYLKSNYAENVSLAQLTSMTNLSPFHLLRVFRNQVGCPPHEYQTQVRIAHARKFLREGKSISDVALETGFFDQSHFSRNFKRIVGVPPGQYSSQSKIVQDTAE
jgi:AraC-like DNA-binding protein